jgi:hypothetical protein
LREIRRLNGYEKGVVKEILGLKEEEVIGN